MDLRVGVHLVAHEALAEVGEPSAKASRVRAPRSQSSSLAPSRALASTARVAIVRRYLTRARAADLAGAPGRAQPAVQAEQGHHAVVAQERRCSRVARVQRSSRCHRSHIARIVEGGGDDVAVAAVVQRLPPLARSSGSR